MGQAFPLQKMGTSAASAFIMHDLLQCSCSPRTMSTDRVTLSQPHQDQSQHENRNLEAAGLQTFSQAIHKLHPRRRGVSLYECFSWLVKCKRHQVRRPEVTCYRCNIMPKSPKIIENQDNVFLFSKKQGVGLGKCREGSVIWDDRVTRRAQVTRRNWESSKLPV
ncbi:hypothetical protein BDZ94DRAFT_1257730 [Collybia nuda]|uniref:Uncharacterized protein n=1 Tax=Collybia nuda TaxID=64659 RepID=A0A9P5Y5X9_9AGAR|nr:hypothetical protein BDZ94DRAFT_1257730 [Collybia nuda]